MCTVTNMITTPKYSNNSPWYSHEYFPNAVWVNKATNPWLSHLLITITQGLHYSKVTIIHDDAVQFAAL